MCLNQQSGEKMFHRNRNFGKKIIGHQNDFMRYNTIKCAK